jgi:hypothetical protein
MAAEAFRPAPTPESNWVEGDDPRISWKDIPAFFNTLDRGDTVGGPTGFVLIPPTAHNREILSASARLTPTVTQ